MLNILIELGVEELPVSEGEKIIIELGETVKDFFRDCCIEYKTIYATGGPRRITLVIEELAERQQDKIVSVYGPPRQVFLDAAGSVTKAGENFLIKNQITINELQFEKKDDGKGKDIEYAVYTKKIQGAASLDLLKNNIKKILDELPIKKRMRWLNNDFLFSRPVRWICAVCNGSPFDLQIGAICSSNITYGHRFLAPEALEICGIDDYFTKLENAFVIADKNIRKKIMLQKMRLLINEETENITLDEELIDINNFLVEFPVPLRAEFSVDFLELPPETLTSTMMKHQKYFPIYDKKSGVLKNSFISITNMKSDVEETIRAGNLRVINARFEDAKFYYTEDLSKNISEFMEKLKKTTYIEGLGSVYDKSERIKKISEFLCNAFCLDDSIKNAALEAAGMCKFDLASGMVYEFPQLQGIIGTYYALKKNIPEIISNTIRDHYLPAGNLNILPASEVAKIVALADKIDTICSCFIIGMKPTGSADPFALRRAARGIIAILINTNYQIRPDLRNFISIKKN